MSRVSNWIHGIGQNLVSALILTALGGVAVVLGRLTPIVVQFAPLSYLLTFLVTVALALAIGNLGAALWQRFRSAPVANQESAPAEGAGGLPTREDSNQYELRLVRAQNALAKLLEQTDTLTERNSATEAKTDVIAGKQSALIKAHELLRVLLLAQRMAQKLDGCGPEIARVLASNDPKYAGMIIDQCLMPLQAAQNHLKKVGINIDLPDPYGKEGAQNVSANDVTFPEQYRDTYRRARFALSEIIRSLERGLGVVSAGVNANA